MSSGCISVRFEESGLKKGRTLLAQITELILTHCCQDSKLGSNGSIDVLYCSEKRIQQLNRDFRGFDEATDVLSFPVEPESQSLLPVEQRHLGDLAICLKYVERQAAGNNSTLGQDVALFLVHGYLHLVGFDHATAGEKKAMFREQDRLLQEIAKQMQSELSKLENLTITP